MISRLQDIRRGGFLGSAWFKIKDLNDVSRFNLREFSSRSLTLGYVVALGIVAVMTLASNLTVGQVLKVQETAASGINVAGRQRMLSQRIAGLAAERILDLPVQSDLDKAIDQFESAHRKLVHGDIGSGLDPETSPDLQDIYFGDAKLDAAVADFIRRARGLSAMTPGSPDVRQICETLFAAARGPLLTNLDRVVSIHQKASDARVRQLQTIQFGSIVVTIMTLVVEAMFIFRPMVMRMARYTRALMKIAATDPLTGALNRRSFKERASAELSRALRYRRSTSLLMIDADHFKDINDRFGHAAGDAVLQALASDILWNLRPSDLLGRIGGEEFCILLAETDLDGALVAAERIRRSIAALKVPVNDIAIDFKISVGVTEFKHHDMGLQKAMERADAALYEAKAGGRNRVVAAPISPPCPAAEFDVALAVA